MENITISKAEDCAIWGCGVKVAFCSTTNRIIVYRLDENTMTQMSKPAKLGCPIIGDTLVQDFEDYSCKVERNVAGVLGTGERMTIVSQSTSTGLYRKCILETAVDEDGVIYMQTSYQPKLNPIKVDRYLGTALELCEADQYLWSYNGGGEGPLHYYDTLQKIDLTATGRFKRENMHNSLAAGIPVADIYNAYGGIAIGDASATRREVHTPIRQTDDSAQISIEWPGRSINQEKGGDFLGCFIIVHKGDYYNGLRGYKNAMEHIGVIMLKDIPQRSYELRWEGWGWQFEWTVDRIINKLDELQAAGVKQITLDDGWYKNAGDWDLNPEKFPNGVSDMHRLVDAIHAHGMSALLWWRPCDGGRHSVLYQEHPEYFIKQADGTPISVLSAVGNPVGDSYALCPTSPGAIAATQAFINRAMKEWHFDGFKGDYVWSISKCYDKTHHHPYPEESTERQTDIYKAAREAMVANDPDAFNLLCHCGAPQDFYGMQYMTQMVTADPTSLDQTRRRVKAYKALMGDCFPVTTDHSAINNFITPEHTDVWYAAGVGTGAVLIEKFDFSGDEQKEYERWLKIADREQLHKAKFVGGLYNYGFDPYETYVVKKGDDMYYAFYRDGQKYCPKGYPALELKGLKPDKLYRVIDYVNDRVVATNLRGACAVFNTRFTNYLLVKAVEIAEQDNESVDQDWGFKKVKANVPSIVYSENWQKSNGTNEKGNNCFTQTPGDKFTFTFAGTAIRWYGEKSKEGGKAEVFLDDKPVATVCTGGYSEERVRLFEAVDIPAAVHTLKVVCKTGKINLDSLCYEEAVPEPVYEKVGALSERITYSGNWQVDCNEVFYEETAKSTEEVGAVAEFSFIGTAIRWYGKRSLDFGIADVYLDGELEDSVYSYGEARFGQLLFERKKLAYGEHTIRIVHRMRCSDLEYLSYANETE